MILCRTDGCVVILLAIHLGFPFSFDTYAPHCTFSTSLCVSCTAHSLICVVDQPIFPRAGDAPMNVKALLPSEVQPPLVQVIHARVLKLGWLALLVEADRVKESGMCERSLKIVRA